MKRIIPDVMKASVPETAKTDETACPYGMCPECGAAGVSRERRPNGNDTCANNHTYASAKAVASTKEKQTARIENTAEGKCPSCQEQMRLSSANGIPVHVCMQHSVVMPIRDPDALSIRAGVETAMTRQEARDELQKMRDTLNKYKNKMSNEYRAANRAVGDASAAVTNGPTFGSFAQEKFDIAKEAMSHLK